MNNINNKPTFIRFNQSIYLYFILSITNKLNNDKQKDEFNNYLEVSKKDIRALNSTSTSKEEKSSYSYVSKVIEKSKFNIVDFKELEKAAKVKFMKDNDSIEVKEELTIQIEAISTYLQNKNLTLEKLRTMNNDKSKKYYQNNKIKIKNKRLDKIKESGKVAIGRKTGATNDEKLKRMKSLSLVFSIFKELELKGSKKITASSIYNIVKESHNDCLKQRQIGKYLQEIKKDSKAIENELKELESLEEICLKQSIKKNEMKEAKLLAKKERSMNKLIKYNTYWSNIIDPKKEKISNFIEKEFSKRKVS